jgi:hypothetical protein
VRAVIESGSTPRSGSVGKAKTGSPRRGEARGGLGLFRFVRGEA